MPHPKLTAILNNCALHAITPEICAEITEYGRNEAYDNQHNPHYLRLKDVFAEFYGFDVEKFTWKHLDGILGQYNPFEQQVILGPVLRNLLKYFMRENTFATETFAQAEPTAISVEDYIQLYTEPRDELLGRYKPIGPYEVAVFFGTNLGLSIFYHQGNNADGEHVENEIAVVEIFHSGDAEGIAGGHWERAADVRGCIDYQLDESTKLGFLLPLLGEHPVVSQFGLELLKGYVLNAAINNERKLDRIKLSCSQIQQYLEKITVASQIRAIELLSSTPTKITTRFIKEYEFVPVPMDQDVGNMISMPAAHLGYQDSAAKQLMAQALKGVPKAKQLELKSLARYDAICEQAREKVKIAVEAMKALDVDFTAASDLIEVEQHQERLASQLERLMTEITGELDSHCQQKRDFPHLTATYNQKFQQVVNAALQKKRQLLIAQLQFDGYIARFDAKARQEEHQAETDPNYREAANAARALVTALTEAKKKFMQEKIPLANSKRALKKDCTDAVVAARRVLNNHRDWKGVLTKFLFDVISFLTRGMFDERLRLFAKSDYEIKLDEFETDVINNAVLSPLRA